MSEAPPPLFTGPPAPTPPRPRSGCMVALMIVAGVILLLPGICALVILGGDPMEAVRDLNSAMALLGFLAIAAGGVALIWWAIRRPSP
jgi:hypothetical protein